jgi:lipoprotein NlpD
LSFTSIKLRVCTGSVVLRISALLLACLLSACSNSPSNGVSVVDRNGKMQNGKSSRQPVRTGHYVVQRGDTLYSIAFRFGWDWKILAQRNHISAPYVIRSGQVIRFDGRTGPLASGVQSAKNSNPPVRAKFQPVALARSGNVPSVASKTVQSAPSRAVKTTTNNALGRWTWPANGELIAKFSSNGSLNKGIDLAGELGEPVLAASDGSVVYAGSGLRGYGELIIIKHSDTYVSAYGHNRRLLVREGQQVKVGQVIAEMGSTGTDQVKLHFEIRRQGKPVDPLQYLPKR